MFEQINLKYEFSELEPSIDALTMETHYGKHHKTYTTNLNDAVAKAGLEGKTIEEILKNLDAVSDPALRKAIRNNGGGYYNHNLYFATMTPGGKALPESALKTQIEKQFGSLESLKEELTKTAVGQFGSGWAFLSVTPEKELVVSGSANQDNPLSEGSANTPILGIDVWEHAYYLKYKNLRGDYVKAFFEVLDWEEVAKLYEK